MAGLGEEGPLPLLGLLQGLEQGVHRLHHAPELVLGQAVGHGVQAVWASARDLPGHGLQGPGGEAGREVDQSQAQGEEEEEGAEEGFPEGPRAASMGLVSAVRTRRPRGVATRAAAKPSSQRTSGVGPARRSLSGGGGGRAG